MTTIADRLKLAQHRIAQAAEKYTRNPKDIKLLAVSKTKPVELIINAYDEGQRHFGENYVQEGEEKAKLLKLSHPDIVWHFIGPLQSNKSRIVAEHFDWMHTLSRGKIASRLNAQRPQELPKLNVCIQVNISNEESKSGVDVNEVMELAQAITALPKLKLRGLMAIPTATSDIDIQNNEFAQLKSLFDEMKQRFADIDTLSMGMSQDLEQAIANGSTMVRIGSAIFGARD